MTLDRLVAGASGSPALAFLVEAALQGTLLLAVAALLVLALRRGSAAHRHLVWACALVGLVALPIMLALLPAWRVSAPALAWLAPGSSAPPAAESSQAPSSTPAPQAAAPVSPPPSAVEPPAPAPPPAPQAPIAWPTVALALWAIGAIAVLSTFVAGHAMLRLLLRGARPVRDGEWHALALEAADRLGLTLPFALLRGEGVLVPVAFGLVRPRFGTKRCGRSQSWRGLKIFPAMRVTILRGTSRSPQVPR